ncbi:hypothetical protein TMatcc_010444 [Talaromyces marneffei ATCC 18224]|uniref:2-oxoadipate dioxygenase/decarboxylase n=1 Tax=Talaromyces marneffei (strain ATCC 18224 / CBS 334.59 / QM 7333) TaxID=441960 RepID=B6QVK8_TALMQ|nr:uncharacterized protein EYB26_009765 [Talaromyces marneffei]EEA19013.1 conserved hypothetical protein [Talaromyces marneffei ATCC 18224]KAE8548708.1 hypothetical protein EYB25_009089 [Talaromyces marneffei]QGA22051.1 hypothetical protein EYB26_009765 [Talaromyces marneffei]
MTATLLPNKEPYRLLEESPLVHPDELRTAFALAMSHMYKNEVPLYGDLVRIVQSRNHKVIANSSSTPDSLDRLTLERHGAIRLGKPEELQTVSRIFALLGMHAVGYYDLSVAGLPMHATCFRPIDTASLATNPFRVFTTLLRPDLIRSPAAHDLALQLLERRNIFSKELLRMLDIATTQTGQFRVHQAEIFIREALRTFSWAPVAEATETEYQLLRAEHPILADIASFRTAHINHLTPRTLDIEAAQAAMAAEGMPVKDRIEGPPRRKWPILLRQTSFLALEEKIQFKIRDSDSESEEEGDTHNVELVDGSHKARFGEIEERGAAVTPAGRALYDQLLESSMHMAEDQRETIDEALVSSFRAYPDTWEELRKQELVYVKYGFTAKLPSLSRYDVVDSSTIESLIEDGVLETTPITYEDFLPFSAAGIFQSNLNQKSKSPHSDKPLQPKADLEGFERALGCSVIDPDVLYARAQKQSLESSLLKLKSLLLLNNEL